MKLSLWTSILLCLFLTQNTQAQNHLPPKPEPAKYVNDFAKFMSQEEINTLESKLKQYADASTTQIVVVTVETLGGYTVKEYANDLAQNWGIGQKGADNGLLILASKQERKVRIEVGYGLEAKITDAFSKKIINEIIIPSFKNGSFYQGFEEGIEKITKALEGEVFEDNTDKNNTNTTYIAPPSESKDISIGTVLLIMLIVLIIFIAIYFYRAGKKQRQNILEMIQENLNSEKWQKLFETYNPTEVQQKQEELLIKYSNLEGVNKQGLLKINRELGGYIFKPEEHFTVRLDKQMIEFGNQIIASFMTQEIFESSSREEIQTSIEKEIAKFNNRTYDSFAEDELAKIQENIYLYKVILEVPYDHFKVNYDFIEDELHKIKTEDFWQSYTSSGKYKNESIKDTQHEFEEEHHSIFTTEDLTEKQEAMLTFYTNTFYPFLESPTLKFSLITVTKPTYTYRSTGSTTYHSRTSYSNSSSYGYSDSSSYSYSDSSSYSDYSDSYSDYSDSYSDFGGGSFGGGGADGDW